MPTWTLIRPDGLLDHVEAPRPREPQHRLHRDQITGQGDAARWPAAARSESGACVRRGHCYGGDRRADNAARNLRSVVARKREATGRYVAEQVPILLETLAQKLIQDNLNQGTTSGWELVQVVHVKEKWLVMIWDQGEA